MTSRSSARHLDAARRPAYGVEAAGVDVVMLDDVYGRLGRRALDERLDRRAGLPRRQFWSNTCRRVRPSRSELSLVPLAPRARAATRRRRARGVSRALLRVHVASQPQNALAVVERVMARCSCAPRRASTCRPTPGADILSPYIRAAAKTSSRCRFRPRFRGATDCPTSPNAAGSSWERRRSQLVGHFGTFGSGITPMLAAALTSLLERSPMSRRLPRVGQRRVRPVAGRRRAELRGRVLATGRISRSDAASLERLRSDAATVSRWCHDSTDVSHGEPLNGRAVVTTRGT